MTREHNYVSKNGCELLGRWQDDRVEHEDGRVAICFGLSATLYFNNGHTEEKRRASLECFKEFTNLCASSLRWGYMGAVSAQMRRVDGSRIRNMSSYLLSPKWNKPESREDGWAFYWHGGKHQHDASALRIEAYGSPQIFVELDNSLSYLRVSFPVLWFVERSEGFPSLILRWCERLKPYHGYGGITLLESPNRGLAQNYSRDVVAYASRFPGLEIDKPMLHKLATLDGIKGGNWLTVLSTRFVEILGGRDNLCKALGEPFVVEDYEGGLMIVAGPVPVVGDRNRNFDVPLYRKLAGVLKPIRIQYHPEPYVIGRFAEEGEFAAWLARFDE